MYNMSIVAFKKNNFRIVDYCLVVELLYGYRRNFNCFFAADSWGARAAKRFAFRCLAAYSAAGKNTRVRPVWGRKKVRTGGVSESGGGYGD